MFEDFRKHLDHAARQVTPVAMAIAPAYKAASVAVAGVLAPYAAPFIAALPADVDLAVGLAYPTGGLSLFLLAPEFRPHGKGVEVDYASLGFAAANAAIKSGV